MISVRDDEPNSLKMLQYLGTWGSRFRLHRSFVHSLELKVQRVLDFHTWDICDKLVRTLN